VIQTGSEAEPRTLAVQRSASGAGTVMTFEDITQQLVDQRRAAWSDVARRIAHEIKNPLTPIQLAAERIRRRYGPRVAEEEAPMLDQLTGTIIRQVGDLRNIVDEFSSFARMPKAIFRPESLTDIVRHALFLHDVAHPEIAFRLDAPDEAELVCDRRQLGQAVTNIIKNAVEAIAARAETDSGFALSDGRIAIAIRPAPDRPAESYRLTIADNGAGLPEDRSRITEPYMTTRSRGTGLGLAIVKKIVEEHLGSIEFGDAPGGGTVVTVTLLRDAMAEPAAMRSPPGAMLQAAEER
jgi:two-component system nitrogen regulation sensor histidine kinase NtrY